MHRSANQSSRKTKWRLFVSSVRELCYIAHTTHTCTNRQVNKWFTPPLNSGHSLAILGNGPRIQILWSMPPNANQGVPALLAVQLVLKCGGMPSQTTPTQKCKVVASNSLNLQIHMWERAHPCTHNAKDAHVNPAPPPAHRRPLLLILWLVFDFSGNRALRETWSLVWTGLWLSAPVVQVQPKMMASAELCNCFLETAAQHSQNLKV